MNASSYVYTKCTYCKVYTSKHVLHDYRKTFEVDAMRVHHDCAYQDGSLKKRIRGFDLISRACFFSDIFPQENKRL